MDHYLSEVFDLLDPNVNRIQNMTVDEARKRVMSADPDAVREIQGSFALVGREGKTVRLARSLDRPMRYFMAKREAGPALIVAERIDTIAQWLKEHGMEQQFHPSYTRMAPAHYVVEIHLVGCPDPAPTYTRFFTPKQNTLPPDVDEIGRQYIGALCDEIAAWLRHVPEREPIGVCFSGGIDSGAVFLCTYHVLRKLGMNPGRLKAFTLHFGQADDLEQARRFLGALDLGLFLEPINGSLAKLDVTETIRLIEDYKPLDVQCASMGMALCAGIRSRYPEWRYLVDGDGGDENLKDYPIEENPELTIRSVVHNLMLYHEGWGVGRMKHSLTYSGGLSRSYTRTYAPGRRYQFEGFSPFTRAALVEVAEAIPFIALTSYDIRRLYALKGEIVSRGVKAIAGFDMPVFDKRRFQDGAVAPDELRRRLPLDEVSYRKSFLALYQ